MRCPVCDVSRFEKFLQSDPAVARCGGCGCISLEPRTDAPQVRIPHVVSRYLTVLQNQGFQTGSLLTATDQTDENTYDAALLPHQLQAHPDPGDLLQRVHAALKPGAPLLVTIPPKWAPRPHDFWFFDEAVIQLLLLRHGFHEILIHRNSEIMVTAVRAQEVARPKCSIIVAAYNERATFPILMDALLKKEIPGVDREIIVIESGSTDGTCELALQYQSHRDFKLVLQDSPRGKGHAVREGFRHATGDIVLIQDADLEYDLGDYDALLAPILSHRALFVLGTRHSGAWKIRHFANQNSLAAVLNLAHAFFTGLINVLYRQKLTDPFTMYKVFHRDCLFGLEFQCNRFDFDHELVIKFVRKGYRPLEIPVNYSSRSFREGKKVRLFRDPLTWLWVDLKLRLIPVMSSKRAVPLSAPPPLPAVADNRRERGDAPAKDRER